MLTRELLTNCRSDRLPTRILTAVGLMEAGLSVITKVRLPMYFGLVSTGFYIYILGMCLWDKQHHRHIYVL